MTLGSPHATRARAGGYVRWARSEEYEKIRNSTGCCYRAKQLKGRRDCFVSEREEILRLWNIDVV